MESAGNLLENIFAHWFLILKGQNALYSLNRPRPLQGEQVSTVNGKLGPLMTSNSPTFDETAVRALNVTMPASRSVSLTMSGFQLASSQR